MTPSKSKIVLMLIIDYIKLWFCILLDIRGWNYHIKTRHENPNSLHTFFRKQEAAIRVYKKLLGY
ncbi:hypothetical protein J1D01_10570 [Seonamhaeicola sp. NFXS20]|uniref:hypothetical protein n=1 Tax=Seonamhaeicola sp. NFXS20 TaxID=2816959 RepID=UPI003B8DD477